ncbi:MAG: transposase [Pseudomonadota bacterium]
MHHLAKSFAVAISGYAIMDNHFHLVVFYDPRASEGWSSEEVAYRWTEAFPPRCKEANDEELEELKALQRIKLLEDPERLARCRRTLGSLSDFMKHLKQPIARRANKEDNCQGHFFEGRFYSGALLDEDAVLAAMAYVDLNPVRAGIARTIEECEYTSVHQRLAEVANRQERLADAIRPLVSGLSEQVPMPVVSLQDYCAHLRKLVIADAPNGRIWQLKVLALQKRERAYGHRKRLLVWAHARGWKRSGGMLADQLTRAAGQDTSSLRAVRF